MANNFGRVHSYKLVLLGDAAVGKSSCVGRFVKDEFLEFQQPTIGAAFLTHPVVLENHIVKFEIWDTAGQERYRSLAPLYYRGACAALVVFDITEMASFHGARTWVAELQRHGNPDIIIALAANKCDLVEQRAVDEEMARSFAQESGCIYVETSAKTGDNINEVFHRIATRLPQSSPPTPHESINLISDSHRHSSRSSSSSSSSSSCCS